MKDGKAENQSIAIASAVSIFELPSKIKITPALRDGVGAAQFFKADSSAESGVRKRE